jgi:uncharacterized membrane protein
VLVLDNDGLMLDYNTIPDGIQVDSLGSTEIAVSYSTLSLTNKIGSQWSVSLTSPINIIYNLPVNAVILGLSSTPLSISIVDNQASVTLPNGTSRITYTLGTTGTRERALVLLNKAEEVILEVKSKGYLVDEAESILEQARNSFKENDYARSEQLSNNAIEKAYQIASTPSDDKPNNTLIVAAALIIVIAGALFFWRYIQKHRTIRPMTPEKKSSVDLDAVFKKHSLLRTDEKAVLRFIHESGGVFVTEIRNRFNIPKSSTWRMMKRLEEQNLIETQMIGRETYVQIKEQ